MTTATAPRCSACDSPLRTFKDNSGVCYQGGCVLQQLHLSASQVEHLRFSKAVLYSAWVDLDDAAKVVDPSEDEHEAYESTRAVISTLFPQFKTQG